MDIKETQQLHCPICATPIPADHVNIQEMAAVCPVCDAVFRFGETSPKIKRRKFKQPAGMVVDETPDGLTLSLPQRVSADDRKGWGISLTMATALGALSILLIADGAPLLLAALVFLFAFIMANTAIAVLVNRRTVTLDAETISTRQGPVPIPIPGEDWMFAEKMLLRQEVARVFCEQTEESRKSGQLIRHYHVCLGLPDGERVFLLKALPQAHAFYTAQVLEEALFSEEEPIAATARLVDGAHDVTLSDEAVTLDTLLDDGEFSRDIEG